MRVYYAHCQAIYNTPQELRDVLTLQSLGFTILNPNRADIQERAQAAKAHCVDRLTNAMDKVFLPLINQCDALAFRALPDGAIPAGIAKEIAYAQSQGLTVFELPSGVVRRTIGVTETREYLHEVGQR